MTRFVIALGVAAGMVQLAAIDEARACSCFSPELTGVSPTPGSAEVPLNTRLWMPARQVDERGAPVLRDSTGKTIALSGTRMIATSFETAVFTPEEDLAPNAAFTVTVGEDDTWVFTTGATRDESPPALPTVTDRSVFSSPENMCGPQAGITFSIDHDGFLVVVDRDGTEQLDAQNLSGTVANMANARMVTMGKGCSSGWPNAAAGASATFRFGVFDRAGNFSGWTQASISSIDLTDEESLDQASSSCTCAGVDRRGGSGAFFAIAALALVMVFSRSRTRDLAGKAAVVGAGAIFAIIVLQLAGCGGGEEPQPRSTETIPAAQAADRAAPIAEPPPQLTLPCPSVQQQSIWCATLFNGELNSGAMIGLDDGELCETGPVPASDGISSLYLLGTDIAACDARFGSLISTNILGGSISGSPFPCEAVTRWNQGYLMRFVPGTPAFVLGPNQPSPDGNLVFYSSFDAVWSKNVASTIPIDTEATRMAVMGDTLYMTREVATEVERYQLPGGEDLGKLAISGFTGKVRGLGAAGSSLILTDGRELFIYDRETGALVRSLSPLPEHSAIFGLACQERL